MTLDGRVAIVSGGSRGVGRAVCEGLAADGANVVVNYRRDEQAAAETVAAVEKLGRKALAFRAPIDVEEDVRAMVDATLEEFGHIDILINNAGIASRGNLVVDTTSEELRRVVSTHAFGAHHLCRLVLPTMRERPRGDIIMISSAATDQWPGASAPYNMAKAALEALAFTLAKEEVRFGIRVNVVAPGLVETEMGRRLMKASGIDDLRQLDAVMPYGRVCQPGDVANVVRFLVSDAGGYVNGQRIYVHGGSATPIFPSF